MTGKIGPVALALGYAGLLPQIALVAIMLIDYPNPAYDLPALAAFGYASLILSFLGGVWWTIAMRRADGQASLAVLSVIPSLLPVAAAPLAMLSWRLPLALIGASILLTLIVDRQLAAAGEAPEGWMALRIPLSLGLGGLTIIASALVRA